MKSQITPPSHILSAHWQDVAKGYYSTVCGQHAPQRRWLGESLTTRNERYCLIRGTGFSELTVRSLILRSFFQLSEPFCLVTALWRTFPYRCFRGSLLRYLFVILLTFPVIEVLSLWFWLTFKYIHSPRETASCLGTKLIRLCCSSLYSRVLAQWLACSSPYVK